MRQNVIYSMLMNNVGCYILNGVAQLSYEYYYMSNLFIPSIETGINNACTKWKETKTLILIYMG